MEELRFRKARSLGWLALALGGLILIAVFAVEFLRTPMVIVSIAALGLAGLLTLADRRVKLAISDAGIRYSRWGPEVVPWQEFSGYRWVVWRRQPQLQLLPRRPTELAAGLSPWGRFNRLCHRILGLPPFSIAAHQLDVPEARLDQLVARYLPRQPGA